MDPRLLLDRKAMKKELKKGDNHTRSNAEAAVNGTKPTPTGASGEATRSLTSRTSLPRHSSSSATSPTSYRSYDPKALLNPRGALKVNRQITDFSESLPNMSLDGFGSSGDDFNHPNRLTTTMPSDPAPPPRKNLLTAYHGVEERTEPPQKKVKITKQEGEEDKRPNRQNSFQHSNGGIGDYMKPDRISQVDPTALNNLVVDLTNDDEADDNEIEVTGARSVLDEEVCVGCINAWVHAHLVPKPKGKSLFESPHMWPTIICTLKRSPDSKTTRINVIDYHGREFGRIDSSDALPLSQAMDGLRGLRTQPRVMTRQKKDGQWPHQPTSERIHIKINLYTRREDAEKIARLFGQHNKWFVTPLSPDKGIAVVNFQDEMRKKAQGSGASSGHRGHALHDTRTIEEAASAVTKLFDHFAGQSAPLEETEAPATIKTPLLPHQKQALTFMLAHERPRTFGDKEEENSSLWRKIIPAKGCAIFEDPVSGYRTDEEPPQVFGGLLADVMGLGKTLEAFTLVASTVEQADKFHQERLIRNGAEEAELMCHSKATLIVCPTSTVQNWETQIKDHIDTDALKHYVYHGPNRTRSPYELAKYDIIVTTYGTITSDHSKKISINSIAPLRQVKWFRIILDEAHTIREQRTTQSEAVNKLWAQRRWCLTGTPIQNRIDDLGALTHFLRLYPYDSVSRFNQYIRSPALSGDSAFLLRLRLFVDSFTLRRLRDKIDLPNRVDVIQDLEFTKVEQQMHDIFKRRARLEVERLAESKNKKSGVQHHVLQAIMTLRLICAHGRDLLKEKDLTVLKGITEEEPINIDEEPTVRMIDKRTAYETLKLRTDADVDFCHDCGERVGGESPSAEADDDETGARCFVLPCLDIICAKCFKKYNSSFYENAEGGQVVPCPFCGLEIAAQYVGIRGSLTETLEAQPDDDLEQKMKEASEKDGYTGPSTKTKALLDDIAIMKQDSEALTANGEPPLKCVVFSEFTSNLSLIERDLAAKGHTFVRIDGSMSLGKRKQVLDALATDNKVTILLASIKAAGQGLNLTAASRAFIMEPMWNPAAEAQAVDRIYRIGQKRDVIIKRYLIKDSIELKIVDLQKKKQALADVTMTRNHKQLSKKEVREQHMKDIVKLFR